MKLGLIVYHKNLNTLYPKEWIEKFKYTIDNQSFKEFDIIELNYGGGTERIFENSLYMSQEYPTFVHAMNYLLDFCFNGPYDAVANTNVDDYYSLDRLECQISLLRMGTAIVSSNFCLVEDDKITNTHIFHTLNIAEELFHNHNIICHPSVMYSKEFWKSNRYIPEQIPLEDLKLWQRSILRYKFVIHPEILCFHRVHNNSVTHSNSIR